MTEYFKVTVSDDLGSRYYTVKKIYRQLFIVVVLLVLLAAAVSIGLNYLQFQHASWLGRINRSTDDQLMQLHGQNRELERSLAVHQQQLGKISNQLTRLETISGVVSSHYDTGLARRTGLLADFYNRKQQPYRESRDASQSPAREALFVAAGTGVDETVGVDPASLTLSHERILYDSIPGGYPTRSTAISGAYGKQTDADSGITIFHKGVDLDVAEGEPVVATADGIVRQTDRYPGSGNRIVIQHNFGFETRYGNIRQLDLAPGDIVLKGDRIGVTGRGHHDQAGLHYEVRYLGRSIDPGEFLKWQFGSRDIFSEVKGIKWPSLINLIDKQLPQNLELSRR